MSTVYAPDPCINVEGDVSPDNLEGNIPAEGEGNGSSNSAGATSSRVTELISDIAWSRGGIQYRQLNFLPITVTPTSGIGPKSPASGSYSRLGFAQMLDYPVDVGESVHCGALLTVYRFSLLCIMYLTFSSLQLSMP